MLFHSNNCLFCSIKILFYIFLFAAYSITVHPVLIAAYSILLTFYSKFSHHCLFYSIFIFYSFTFISNPFQSLPILSYPMLSKVFFSVLFLYMLFCCRPSYSVLFYAALLYSIPLDIPYPLYSITSLFYSILSYPPPWPSILFRLSYFVLFHLYRVAVNTAQHHPATCSVLLVLEMFRTVIDPGAKIIHDAAARKSSVFQYYQNAHICALKEKEEFGFNVCDFMSYFSLPKNGRKDSFHQNIYFYF